MELVRPDININFVGKQKLAACFSVALLLITIVSLIIHKGPKYGIDFAGGTLIQVKFTDPVSIDDIKAGLETINITASTIQGYGHHEPGQYEYLINTDMTGITDSDFSQSLTAAIQSATGQIPEIERVEMVGPQVGKDLRGKALYAIFFALLFINIYISWRFEAKLIEGAIVALGMIGAVKLVSIFHVSIPYLILVALIVTLVLFWFLELKYAMGAIIALIHDVSITVGIFSLMDKEFSLPIIAALLTIIGYSLNDTIIVFDRIRENLKKYTRQSLAENINSSINETLSRTLLTSLTTLAVVVTLYLLGGSIIQDFAFAMIIGVLIGTYSSVFVASPVLLLWPDKKA